MSETHQYSLMSIPCGRRDAYPSIRSSSNDLAVHHGQGAIPEQYILELMRESSSRKCKSAICNIACTVE